MNINNISFQSSEEDWLDYMTEELLHDKTYEESHPDED